MEGGGEKKKPSNGGEKKRKAAKVDPGAGYPKVITNEHLGTMLTQNSNTNLAVCNEEARHATNVLYQCFFFASDGADAAPASDAVFT